MFHKNRKKKIRTTAKNILKQKQLTIVLRKTLLGTILGNNQFTFVAILQMNPKQLIPEVLTAGSIHA
jgi:hypothetical protein